MNGLGSLFSGSQEEGVGLDALKYSAPKESQKRAENSTSPAGQKSTSAPASAPADKSSSGAATGASNIKFSASVYLYKGGSNGYNIVDGGKLGCVVMGGGVDYKILVYNAQKAPQAVITLSDLFTYSIRDLYSSCCDADGNQFSLLFDNVTALTKFIKVIMSITCSLSSQKGSTNIIKGILPSSASQSNSESNATTLAAGMTAGVTYKIWLMESTSDVSTLLDEAPVFTMGSQDDVNKVKVLGTGDLASDVGGVGQSLVGLRKGDVVCLGLPVSVASQGTKDLGSFPVNLSQQFLMVIVEVFKVKSESRKEKKEKKDKKAVEVQGGGVAEPTNPKEAFARALNDKLSAAPAQSALRRDDSAHTSNNHVHFSAEEEADRGPNASANYASASSYDDPSSASMQVTLTADTHTRSYYESESPMASNNSNNNGNNSGNNNGNPYENHEYNRSHNNNGGGGGGGGGGGYPFGNNGHSGYGNVPYGPPASNNNPNSPYMLMDVQKSVQQVHAKLDWMNDVLQRLHNSSGGGGSFAAYGRQNIQSNTSMVSGLVSGDPIDAQIESIVAALQMVSSEHSKSGDADQLRDLQGKISDLQDRNEKLMSEKEGMLTKHADMLNLGAESNKQMLSLQQEINSLRLEASKTQSPAETSPEILAKIKTLEGELSDKQKSISDHVESAASMESELMLLGTKLGEMTVESESRVNQVSGLESQVSSLQEECSMKGDAVESLSSKIGELSERIAHLESEAVAKDAQTSSAGEEEKEEKEEKGDEKMDEEKDKEIKGLKERIAQLESEAADKGERAETVEKGGDNHHNPPAKDVLQDVYVSVIALFDVQEDSSYTTTQVIKGIKKICKTLGNKYSEE